MYHQIASLTPKIPAPEMKPFTHLAKRGTVADQPRGDEADHSSPLQSPFTSSTS